MVKHFKRVDGMGIKFGNGTTRIHSYLVKSRPVGQISLSTCEQVLPGTDGKIVEIKGSPKVVLDFSSIAAVDILIQKLNDLKSLMEDAKYG